MDVMAITYSGLSFRISLQHFQKLQILYDRNNRNHATVQQHQDNFYKALFTVLCRYDMLEGGGLQSALNGNVFDVILNKLNCNMECFASPFNCCYERYCSALPDTDMFFGSMGSFFDFQFEGLKDGGCFQANPPFAADFILAMYRHMEKLLMDDTVDAPFMFIVFIPAWNYSIGWQALSQSTVLTKSILLSHNIED
jgi:phosphorylated CTD-interacting factor 1